MRTLIMGALAFAMSAALAGCSSTASPPGSAALPSDAGTGDADAISPALPCAPDEDASACTWSGARLLTCAPVSGVYGAASWGCATDGCFPMDGCVNYGVVTTTLADGGAMAAPMGQGLYALPLPAGSYDVCYDAGVQGGACAQVVITGAPVRLDVNEQESPGGDYFQLAPPP